MFNKSIIQEEHCQILPSKFIVALLKSLARRVGVASVSGTAVSLGHIYYEDARSGANCGGPNRGGQRLNSFDVVEVVEVEELMVVHELLVKHSLHKVRVDTKALAQGARHGPRGPLRYHPQALRATPEVPEVMRFRPQASNFVSLFVGWEVYKVLLLKDR